MYNFLRLHIRKILFSIFIAVLYYVVANPSTYKFVGSILALDEYDNPNKPDRETLLYIHSVVMGLLSICILFIYNPMNSTLK